MIAWRGSTLTVAYLVSENEDALGALSLGGI
jgi:hypothetical protein